MSKEKRRVPKLRFPGFTEDWEQRKLGECVDISTGYPFDSQDFNENGEYLVITNGNIQENTPFVLNNVGNRIDLDDSLKKYILDIDDLLITMDGTVGRVAIVVDNKLVLAQRVCRIKSNEPYYIYQLLSKNDFIQSMNKIGHGGTIKHISLSEISEYQAFYPKSQKERIKISSVLTNYDKLITLHQRKLDNLKLKKKALLQKLFPKNGERYPELRFPGFTDAWEQREFSDIFAEVKSGLSRMLSNDDIGLPVVRANNINDGQLNLVDDIKYWYKNDPQGANTNNYLIEQGDILINFINSEAKMGTAAYVTRRPERDTIYTTNILRCKVNDEYNPYFIYSLTFLNSYKNYIASITKPAVNQASFTTVDFKKYSIKIPTVKEQNQIADLIETFNKLITLHQQEPFLCRNSVNGGVELC